MLDSNSTRLPNGIKDETGNRYGKLVVTRFSHTDKQAFWLCLCDCGNEKVIKGSKLRDKNGVRSCGCLRRRSGGMCGTPEHNSWSGMRSRCYYKNGHEYHLYGGRGITVCDRWNESFLNFFDDMGPKPSPESSLERIDVNGNYEPGNCKWASPLEQSLNTRTVRIVVYNGEEMSVRGLANKIGIPYGTVSARMHAGMSLAEAFRPPKEKEKLYTCNGVTMCIRDWARRTGIYHGTLEYRLKHGWSIERAIAEPVQVQRGHNCPLEIPNVP